jgi:RNA-binding protein NOB1
VTKDNLYTYINHGDTQALNLLTETPTEDSEPKKVVSPQSVIFLTSDFAMQNVIIQMGFTLMTLDGMRMTRVKRYKLLCRACFTLNLNIEK